jgi:hypothetical protein
MQLGLNFRATDKNVEQLVVVKDAAPSAILRFGTLSANDVCRRLPTDGARKGMALHGLSSL